MLHTVIATDELYFLIEEVREIPHICCVWCRGLKPQSLNMIKYVFYQVNYYFLFYFFFLLCHQGYANSYLL